MSSAWFFTLEELRNVPSIVKDGFTMEQEADYREKTCGFIYQVALELEIPGPVIVTAFVYLHRFYCIHSFKDKDRLQTALACIFLACKVDEQIKKAKDIILAGEIVKIKQKDPHNSNLEQQIEEIKVKYSDEKNTELMEKKDNLFFMERNLLHTFGFDLKVDHSKIYRALTDKAKILGGSKELRQVAFNFANDSFRTTLCLQYKAETIAAAVVYLTAKFKKITLPPNWQELLACDQKDVEIITARIVDLYPETASAVKATPESQPSQQESIIVPF